MPTRRRALLILAVLAGLSQLSIALALMVGSIPISPAEVLATLFGDGGGMAGEVVRSLRLPRALTGFACGGLLALAGALLQVLLRNPLADPYVLGISGGAGIGALLAIVLGSASPASMAWLSLARSAPCCWSSGWRMARAAGRSRGCF
jgi:iron complex transport system permease protein